MCALDHFLGGDICIQPVWEVQGPVVLFLYQNSSIKIFGNLFKYTEFYKSHRERYYHAVN